jgi:hypothetical protein
MEMPMRLRKSLSYARKLVTAWKHNVMRLLSKGKIQEGSGGGMERLPDAWNDARSRFSVLGNNAASVSKPKSKWLSALRWTGNKAMSIHCRKPEKHRSDHWASNQCFTFTGQEGS